MASSTTIAGLVNVADRLTFTPAVGWTQRTAGTNFLAYTESANWSGNATNFAYPLALGASVPEDYYRVTLVAAGSDGTGQWSQSQQVVIHVTPVPEPASLAAMGLSGGLLLLRRRRLARAI